MVDNGRKSGGFSIREALRKQGVSTDVGMHNHLSLLAGTLATNPSFDLTSYRVNPNHPNELPYMG